MSFEYPRLGLLVLFVLLIIWLGQSYFRFRKNRLDALQTTFFGPGQSGSFRKRKWFWMLILGWIFLAIAATNPRLKGEPTTVSRKGGDVVFALDVSKSMMAEDVKPNRLDRAKLICLNLLKQFDVQRVALVVFAGDAYVTMPFTTNYEAVANFISEANTGQVSSQGSDYANLIQVCEAYFGKDKNAQRGILVLSDGEDHSQLTDKMVKAANQKSLYFYTIGIGTSKGAPIPSANGYKQNKSGQKVISKLNPAALKQLAGTKGTYYRLSEARQVINDLKRLKETNFSDIQTFQYKSLFQVFLLPGMILIFLFLFADSFGRIKN